jgi:hypothetical protein
MDLNQAQQVFRLAFNEIPDRSDDPSAYPETTGVYRLPIDFLKKDFKFSPAKLAQVEKLES